jgi:hypothetical protein
MIGSEPMLIISDIKEELHANRLIDKVLINPDYYKLLDTEQLNQFLKESNIKLTLTNMKYDYRIISEGHIIRQSKKISSGKNRNIIFTSSVSNEDNSREVVLAVMGKGYEYNEDINILKARDREKLFGK